MSNGKNSNRSWRVALADLAKKQLRRIPAKDRERISKALETFEGDPWSGDVYKLSGDEISWRRRVGNYRIIFDILSAERTIFVYDIRRRTSSTY